MKYLHSILFLALSCGMAGAALTITIFPNNVGGTTFFFRDTNTNPLFQVSNDLGRSLFIELPPSMFAPLPVVVGIQFTAITREIKPVLATFIDSGSGFSYDIATLNVAGDLSFASFDFNREFANAQDQVEGRFSLLPGPPVSSGLSPLEFVQGTHTVSSRFFESVTVIVIPEPTSFLFLVLSTIILSKRHRCQEWS